MEKIKKKLENSAKIIKDTEGFYNKDKNIRFNFDVLPAGNFILDYVNHYSDLTESPDEFLLTSLISYLSAMIGNRIYIEQSIGITYPNIWAVIVGKTTALRKSTALNLAEDLLNRVGYEYFYPQIIHSNTLIEKLEIEPYGIFIYNEWKSFASRIEKQKGSDLKSLLTELYDKHTYQKIIKKKDPHKDESKLDKTFIKNVSISLVIASTLDWLDFQKSDLTSGFMPRFIFSTVNENYKDPIPFPKNKSNNGLVNDLMRYKREVDNGKKEIKMSAESKEIYSDWYIKNSNQCNKSKNGVLPGFWHRLEGYVIKFAMILHATGNDYKKDTISAETMRSAIKIQQYYRENINYLVTKKFTINEYQKAEQKVISYLEDHNGQATRREIQGSVRSARNGSFLDQILNNLIEDKIVEYRVAETGGRKKKVVKLLN